MLMLIRILILNQRQGSPHRSFGAYEVSPSSKDTLRPCSIGINRFWLVWLVEFFRGLLAENRSRLVWLINFFNQLRAWLKRLKTVGSVR